MSQAGIIPLVSTVWWKMECELYATIFLLFLIKIKGVPVAMNKVSELRHTKLWITAAFTNSDPGKINQEHSRPFLSSSNE